MLLRLILSGLLVSSLAGFGMAAAAEAAAGGMATGKTAQGYRIKLAMRGDGSFRIVRFSADLRCRDGSTLQLEESGFLPTLVKPDGTFREMQYGRTDRVYMRGRVSGKTVSGRLRLTDRYGKGNPCKSRWIKFRAS